MFIFIEKSQNRVELYGSAKIMFESEKELIKIGILRTTCVGSARGK